MLSQLSDFIKCRRSINFLRVVSSLLHVNRTTFFLKKPFPSILSDDEEPLLAIHFDCLVEYNEIHMVKIVQNSMMTDDDCVIKRVLLLFGQTFQTW